MQYNSKSQTTKMPKFRYVLFCSPTIFGIVGQAQALRHSGDQRRAVPLVGTVIRRHAIIFLYMRKHFHNMYMIFLLEDQTAQECTPLHSGWSVLGGDGRTGTVIQTRQYQKSLIWRIFYSSDVIFLYELYDLYDFVCTGPRRCEGGREVAEVPR